MSPSGVAGASAALQPTDASTDARRTDRPQATLPQGALDVRSGPYVLARRLCANSRVLDAGCAEGAGARMLRDWGALSIEAVDGAPEQVDAALRAGPSERLRFSVADLERLDQQFEKEFFDLAIAAGSIARVLDAGGLLRGLRHVVRPGGTIIVACPNDYWQYPAPEERHPLHQRKFTFEQLRVVTEEVLGAATAWGIGLPIRGACNLLSAPVQLDDRLAQGSGLEGPVDEALAAGGRLRPWQECSYFVGVWGPEVPPPATMLFEPVEMSAAGPAHLQSDPEVLQATARRATARAESAEARLGVLEKENRALRLLELAARKENEVLRSAMENVPRVVADEVRSRLQRAGVEAVRKAGRALFPRSIRAALNRVIGRG